VGKRWTWVAWSMLAVFVVGVVFTYIFSVRNGTFDPSSFVVLTLGFSAFMVVGAMIVAHRPNNAIGWIFSAIALLTFTSALAYEYAFYGLVTRPGLLPGVILMAWYSLWPWYPALALALVFTPFLFPTGRLLSPRWRPAAWLAGAVTAVFTVLAALRRDLELTADHVIPNPIGVAAAPVSTVARRGAPAA
jgi:hypothetical protein